MYRSVAGGEKTAGSGKKLVVRALRPGKPTNIHFNIYVG